MRVFATAFALVFSTGLGVMPVLAEETIIQHEGPGPAAVAPRAGVAVERGGVDCSSKTVHRENAAGDSTTVHSSNCD